MKYCPLNGNLFLRLHLKIILKLYFKLLYYLAIKLKLFRWLDGTANNQNGNDIALVLHWGLFVYILLKTFYKHTYLAEELTVIIKAVLPGRGLTIALRWADPCDRPKCGRLDCTIYECGVCVRAHPVITKWKSELPSPTLLEFTVYTFVQSEFWEVL